MPQSVHPSVVREGWVDPHSVPDSVDPIPQNPRPASPEVLGYRNFCNMSAQARSSPHHEGPLVVSDPRNATTSSAST